MDRQLTEIGTIPVTTSIIESLYPELKSANKKVTWLEKQGFIIRLKRGLYAINPEYSGKTLSSELIANHLYAPSYISMSTALRYYGLIPEAVYVHQSMTVKHSRSFQTPVGCYDYKHISKMAFPIGVRGIKNKAGAASEKEFTIAKNIEGLKIRARGTGDFSCVNLSLDGTLKKASALLGDGTTTDTNPDTGKDTGKDTPGGDNTDQGGSGTTGGEDVGM